MNPNFRDLLHEFCAVKVEFLLVGAHALAAHGHTRATKDLDLWIRPTQANAKRVISALVRFGAPLQGLREKDLTEPDVVFQIGVDPLRIDILTSIDGLEFDEAWTDRGQVAIEGLEVPVLSREHLIRNKRASGRLQDLADVERLEQNE